MMQNFKTRGDLINYQKKRGTTSLRYYTFTVNTLNLFFILLSD